MARNIVKYGDEARNQLALGAQFLYECVSRTLGPYGLNYRLQKGKRITNDGVTIAREITLDDEIQNEGVDSLRESAIKTNDECGDGTTTAIVLAWAIYKAVSSYLAKSGVIGKKTPSEIVRQIEKERIEITEKLITMATPIETEQQLIDSAHVSVEDLELGKLIGSAQWELGKDGILIAEDTADRVSSIERVSGVRIDNGFGTSQLVTNQDKRTCEVEEAKVILTSYSIKDLKDWLKLFKICESLNKAGVSKVIIIARAWTDETINYCLQNVNKGVMKIYPFNAPYVDMQERMKDLQAVVGGTFYDSENSSLEDMQVSDVGYATKIVGRLYDAVITGPNDEETTKRIAKRVSELTTKLQGTLSDFERKNIEQRIAQLQNGFALIKVGSSSDLERNRLLDKCEDAVNAVRAAYQEGTVKGAGIAFKEIADSLSDDYLLKIPLQSINEQIMSSSPSDFVVEDWVRDPVKVLRLALENACTAASNFATASGVVAQRLPKPIDELFAQLRKE